MSYYYNVAVANTTKTYHVEVYTADCYKYEYLVNANTAKEAQSIGYRKTFKYYADCGIKEAFHPTKILAHCQSFLTI